MKVVRAKAKTGLQPSFYIQENDIQVLQGSQPAHTTVHKVQSQGAMHRGEDFKAFKALTSTSKSEPSNKARKDQKKKQHRDKRDSREFRDTPISGINTTRVKDKKRRRKKKDPREVMCYNCK